MLQQNSVTYININQYQYLQSTTMLQATCIAKYIKHRVLSFLPLVLCFFSCIQRPPTHRSTWNAIHVSLRQEPLTACISNRAAKKVKITKKKYIHSTINLSNNCNRSTFCVPLLWGHRVWKENVVRKRL